MSHEHISYAALDVYASLRIYEELMKIAAPGPLPASNVPLPGLPVLLYSTDNTRIIARGAVSPRASGPQYDGINITKTRTVITVQEIVVPAAIVTTHHQRDLTSFGTTPFDLVCLRSHLRTYPTHDERELRVSARSESTPRLSSSPASILDASEPAQLQGHSAYPPLTLTAGSVSESIESEDPHDDDDTSRIGVGILEEEGHVALAEGADIPQEPEDLSTFEVDEAGQILGNAAVADTQPGSWDSLPIRSRVIKDAWHICNMLKVPKAHGLRVPFAR